MSGDTKQIDYDSWLDTVKLLTTSDAFQAKDDELYKDMFDRKLTANQAACITDANSACRITASGFTTTTDAVYDWIKQTVGSITAQLGSENLICRLWAYREQGHEMVSLDVFNDKDDLYCITFTLGFSHDYYLEEPSVPDCVEAMHMAGAVISALNIKTTIGRQNNEVNKYCDTSDWAEGQTNGCITVDV